MKSNNIGKARFILLLLGMLAYSAQSLAFAGHMGSAASFVERVSSVASQTVSEQLMSSSQLNSSKQVPSTQIMSSSPQKMQGCHGSRQSSKALQSMSPTTDSSTMVSSTMISSTMVSSAKVSSTNDCCEDGCTMIGCHMACALISSLRPPLFNTCQIQKHSVNLGLVVKPSSSLYRPPILR